MGGVTGRLPPLAAAIDAALRDALSSGALPCAAGDVRQIVAVVCGAISAHSRRVLPDPMAVAAGYARLDRDERIRELRGRGLAVAALAERFGLSARQVHRIVSREGGGAGGAA